jgi:hypothetical protein
MRQKISAPLTLVALLFTFIALTPQSANAQSFEIGPRVGYEVDDIDALSIGLDARMGIGALPVRINPYFDYYFVDDIGPVDHSLVQLGINALYEFGIANQTFTPYAGAGLAVTRQKVGNNTNTEPGLNLLFGSRFGFGSIRPFVQGTVSIGDYDFFTVQGGLLFAVGR